MPVPEIDAVKVCITRQEFVTTYPDGRQESEFGEPSTLEIPTPEVLQSRVSRINAVHTSAMGKTVNRLMCLLGEVEKVAREIQVGANSGDSIWHEEFAQEGDEDQEGFLSDVAAVGRLCHSMGEQIETWERSYHRYWAELKSDSFEYFANDL
jgi:hypothetical protein